MKKLFGKFEIPSFMQDARISVTIGTILALSLAGAVFGFVINPLLGLVMLLLFLILIAVLIYLVVVLGQNATNFISNLSYRIKRGEQEALIKMPIGIILFDQDTNKIQWVNPYLQLYLENRDIIGKTFSEVDSDLAETLKKIDEGTITEDHVFDWGDKKFEINLQKELGVVYLLDVTRYAEIEETYLDERLAVGQIFLDNYDELSQSVDDQTISHMNSTITRMLNEWAKQYQMYLKRVDDDHFIILAHAKELQLAEKDKFSILDQIRSETSKQNYPITLSIGFAYGEPSLNELATQSQKNLDLALGRGGDQVVVKEPDSNTRFYGGKSDPMEKRTRVRARMVSQALQELFRESDKVFVMGHKNPDLDAIGAAIGIAKIAQMNGKEAHVVLDREYVNYDVKRLIEKMEASKNDDSAIFMDSQDVLEAATDESLLVMVDHSKPSLTYDNDIYTKLQNRVVIIDHHRRGEEFPNNPILVYIEPYASSTCELVTEMLEYQPKGNGGLTKLEASAMLAGITVDTKAFSSRAGTRTFDAASYLRSIGADNSVVQSLLKEDVNSFIQRNHLVSSLEMVTEDIALLRGENDKIYDSVIAAQAADTALTLDNIDASFVIYRRDPSTVGISARSLGEINVQVVMEKMGGGGHLSNAATQLQDTTVAEASEKLIAILNENPETE